ncbi:MAG: glycine cleavage T C-terminal barrel domain-containing protein [Haloferacaceae archaeon]
MTADQPAADGEADDDPLSRLHDDHGAVRDDGGRIRHYGRPRRTHLAVRNGVGVVDGDEGVVVVTGEDRHEFVDDTVTTPVPREDGTGRYALLLDPQGAVETEMYVFDAAASDRLLLLLPGDRVASLAEDWASKVFVRDVSVRDATDEFHTFGVHGPKATEKLASVCDAAPPEEPLTFTRTATRDAGVTVVAGEGLAGEESYHVVCTREDAPAVLETLLTSGLNAVPVGRDTWETLTLEAGTPLLEAELAGTLPNVAGLRAAFDLDKGCYVGQEVVSRVANRGQPSRRLVGLRPETGPDAGAAVLLDDADGAETVGELTRAAHSPSLDAPVAFAYVPYDLDATTLAVATDDGPVPAERVSLPFVEGSARSARVPAYDDEPPVR